MKKDNTDPKGKPADDASPVEDKNVLNRGNSINGLNEADIEEFATRKKIRRKRLKHSRKKQSGKKKTVMCAKPTVFQIAVCAMMMMMEQMPCLKTLMMVHKVNDHTF